MGHPIIDTKGETYFPLDNAAIIFSHITNKKYPMLFRVQVKLKENINLKCLQNALELIILRYPLFQVTMRTGFFWYYLDPTDKKPEVVADSKIPIEYLNIHKRNRFLFRVRAFRNVVACEFHHVLTDGSGALSFLKSLILEYYKQLGLIIADPLDIITVDTKVDPEEMEDSYIKYFKKGIPKPEAEKKAFHLPGMIFPFFQIRITHGIVSVDKILIESRKLNLSINEYLTTIYLAALQEIFEKMSLIKKRHARKNIAIVIPVSLRKMYPSKTLRNFFLTVAPSIDLRLGHYEFEEIAMRVYHFTRLEATEKAMYRQLSRNVGGELNFLARLAPVPLKTVSLRIVAEVLGDSAYSGAISNLGQVKLPEELIDKVESFDFIPAKNNVFKAHVGVISYKNDLHITFTSLLKNADIEREFFKQLTQRGVPVKIESNL